MVIEANLSDERETDFVEISTGGSATYRNRNDAYHNESSEDDLGDNVGTKRKSPKSTKFKAKKSAKSANAIKNHHAVRDEDSEITHLCKCNLPAVQRKVNKNGPNHGRFFYTCSLKEDLSCGFFLWADVENSTASHQNHTGSSGFNNLGRAKRPNGQYSQTENLADPTLKCNCGLIAKISKVKGGSNVGRPYATCIKTSSTRCKYYAWLDDENEKKSNTKTSYTPFLNYFPTG